MSTSLLYHAFGARNYTYIRTEYREGMTFFHAKKKRDRQQCVECGSRHITREGTNEVTLREVPIGERPTRVVLHLDILGCKDCGACRQESRELADPRKSYTRRFARFVLSLVKLMTISDVARHLGVGWDLVKSILKSDLLRRARKRSWRDVKRIGIDEIAVKKRHKYLTVVVDMDSGQVLYVGKGKDHTALIPFFDRLKRSGAQLEAIAMDMSRGYLKAVKDYGPEAAVIVYDPYHVVAQMNAVIDKVRRSEWRRLEGPNKKVIKGSRYLLLTAREKLEERSPDRVAQLDELLEANEVLQSAYLLKEKLRLFWKQDDYLSAALYILRWVLEAAQVGHKALTKMAQFVLDHYERILAWYHHKITNGPLEGLNNKIKVMKRMAYGYRDEEFFALRILFSHETKFKLSGA